MGLFNKLFSKKPPATPPAVGERNIADIKKMLETAKARHQLPELDEIEAALVAVEEKTNYATLVDIALESAAECRGIYIGELKSAYMQFWWQWHNHRDDPKYRAKKVIVIASEAAHDSKIGWVLIGVLLVWLGHGSPDRSADLKEHFGDVPSLDEIRKYQGTA